MQLAQVLNASQFTLLGLLVAVVVYIRNIPVKELLTKKTELEVEIEGEINQLKGQQTPGITLTIDAYKKLKRMIYEYRWNIRFSLLILNILQICIVFLAVLITGRFIPGWGDRFDTLIFSGILLLALVFLVFHLIKDGEFACRHWRGFSRNYRVRRNPDINKIEQNWKDFKEN